MKYRKISLVLATLLLLSMFSFAFVSNVSAYTVTVDGDPTDWLANTAAQKANTRAYYRDNMLPCGWEYVWKDMEGDDTGNGTYVYPTDPTNYPAGIADILEFRVTSDLSYLYFLFKMKTVANPANDVNGFSSSALVITIDTDNVDGSGEQWLPATNEVKVGGELQWEYGIVLRANASGDLSAWGGSYVTNLTWNSGGWWDWHSFGRESVQVMGSNVTNCIEARVPLSFTDNAGQSYNMGSLMGKAWKFVVGAGFQPATWYQNDMFEVAATADNWNPGGGSDNWADPDLFDMCFYASKSSQEADLNGFSTDTPMFVSAVSYGQGWEEIYFSGNSPACPYAKIHLVDSTNWTRWDLTGIYNPGDTFTLDVIIENITDLNSWDIGAKWDPNILTCNSFKEGTFLKSSTYGTTGALYGVIDNVNGRIYPWYDDALLSAPMGQNGSSTDPDAVYGKKGALANITFTIKSPLAYGSNTWIYLNFTLWDSRGKPITVPVNHAYWEYPAPPPSPPTAKISQSGAPYWVGDPIILWSTSTPGSDGIGVVPIDNCTWTIRNSTGDLVPGSCLNVSSNPVTLDCATYPGCPIEFTPPEADTYTILLEVKTVANAVLDNHVPPWNYDNATTTKTALKRAATFIDCFTNKLRRCGYDAYANGFGPDLPADAYTFDELVTLYAWVVYKNNPMQSRLVSFEVYSPLGLFLVEQNMTNENGVAFIKFRIPTPCGDPAMYEGKWWCFQEVRLCDEYYNDTIMWDVGYIVEVTNVEVIPDPVDMTLPFDVAITAKNIAMNSRDVLISVKVLDDNLVPVNVTLIYTTIDAGAYCSPYVWYSVVPLTLPKWTYPGIGRVIVDVWFHGLPSDDGHCTCPPYEKVFVITCPVPPPPDPA